MADVFLSRDKIGADGAFGVLLFGPHSWFTCEHAYLNQDNQQWFTKIPEGVFKCVKGPHQLKAGGPFLTFEIMGVPGHSGLLFHKGNVNANSEGCVLLGSSRGLLGGKPAVLESGLAFNLFMQLLGNRDWFMLEVKNAYQNG